MKKAGLIFAMFVAMIFLFSIGPASADDNCYDYGYNSPGYGGYGHTDTITPPGMDTIQMGTPSISLITTVIAAMDMDLVLQQGVLLPAGL
jgi:ABC-type transport system involved in cytochrome c biogenesis permease component